MLIEFKVSNYRSIGEEQILSLLPDSRVRDDDNILVNGKYKSLNAIGIYGANASGKSNLLLAMRLLDQLIHLSARSSSTSTLPYDPFLLRTGWRTKPTQLEVTFILNEIKYRYGLAFTQDEITTEYLYRKSVGREVTLFLREGAVIDVSSAFRGNTKIIDLAIEATKPNALFLSTCDMFNIDEAKSIFQWFRHFNMIDGLNTDRQVVNTITLWEDPEYQSKIADYMTKLNIGIVGFDVSIKDFDASELPDSLAKSTKKRLIKELTGKQSFEVLSKHQVYSEEDAQSVNDQLSWKLDDRESSGTQKTFHLSGPILWALTNGGVLIIDEIEASLHPIMTLSIINLFMNKETNPNQAQVIFATHDTNLLSHSKLRRDQIYFAEKNSWESTEIYSLSDFKYLDEKERPDADKEKRYFEGRYGAIPILSDFGGVKTGSNGK